MIEPARGRIIRIGIAASLLLWLVVFVVGDSHGSAVAAPVVVPAPQTVATPATEATELPYFPETGYWIGRHDFASYFRQRGGLLTFGYPISRVFEFMGFPVQLFQRQTMQLAPDGGVRSLNLLDAGLMPYTTINGSTLPPPDPAVISEAPSPAHPDYARLVIEFVERFAPNEWNGTAVNFGDAFLDTVGLDDAFPDGSGNPALLPLLALEMWGVPTSRPMVDPNNAGFVYLRFQRGIMHFDVSHGLTQPLLMADYFKAILTGENLPLDLAAQAASSPFLGQLRRPAADSPDPSWPFAPESPVQTPAASVLQPRYRDRAAMGAPPAGAIVQPVPIQPPTSTPGTPPLSPVLATVLARVLATAAAGPLVAITATPLPAVVSNPTLAPTVLPMYSWGLRSKR